MTLAHLERQRQTAEAGRLPWFQIKVDLLRALAYRALNDDEQARATLTHALHVAQPEGYIRVFIDEGEPM